MLVMRTVAADMRHARRPLAPAHLGTLMKIAPGPCTMSELARHQVVGLPTMSKSIDTLVRRGWVERLADRRDRRQSLVRLTSPGRRVLAAIKLRTERHVENTLHALTRPERARLMAVLRVLTRVLAPANDDRCESRSLDHSLKGRLT